MKRKIWATAFLTLLVGTVMAQSINMPIVQTKFTAGPAPYVHNDTVYLTFMLILAK